MKKTLNIKKLILLNRVKIGKRVCGWFFRTCPVE